MKAEVTVTHKNITFLPEWYKVHIKMLGDCTNLIVLMNALKAIKAEINTDMNRKGYALHDVNIHIDLIK